MSVLPVTMFRLAPANGHLVLAHISDKMRKLFIRPTIDDRVKMGIPLVFSETKVA